MTYVLEGLTHKIEGQPPKKEVSWVLGKGKSLAGVFGFVFWLTQKESPSRVSGKKSSGHNSYDRRLLFSPGSRRGVWKQQQNSFVR